MVCGKYIELNPVRAKIVDKPEEYVWSSYNVYIGERGDNLISLDPLYEGLGKTNKERRIAYQKMVYEDLNLNARYLGSNKFIKTMEGKFGIANLKRDRGRPRKNLEK